MRKGFSRSTPSPPATDEQWCRRVYLQLVGREPSPDEMGRFVRSREADLAEAMTSMARRATVVAHLPPLTRGARPAHILVGSEADLPEAGRVGVGRSPAHVKRFCLSSGHLT